MAADINKPKIRDKSVKLLRKKPKILVNKAWICRHITKYYEIFKDNDESMYTSSGSIIATTGISTNHSMSVDNRSTTNDY